jgi:hypothetical protein
MGNSSSKTQMNDICDSIEENKITVNFIQLQKMTNCNVIPEQLNILLGLNIPKYSVLDGTNFPYLFCVGTMLDINDIIRNYGYEIGFTTKQKVLKNEYNAKYQAICSYRGYDFYRLELI